MAIVLTTLLAGIEHGSILVAGANRCKMLLSGH
jgi:hypothetical protein